MMADQWLQNEMRDEKASFKAHEKGTCSRGVLSSVPFLNTVYMKGEKGHTVTYWVFIPLVSSAATTPCSTGFSVKAACTNQAKKQQEITSL